MNSQDDFCSSAEDTNCFTQPHRGESVSAADFGFGKILVTEKSSTKHHLGTDTKYVSHFI